MKTEEDKMGLKAKRIFELHAHGFTPTDIMEKTGYSLAWIRETIARAEMANLEREEKNED
jgi:hypothetical protein